MHGIGRAQQAAADRLHHELSASPVGQRWERMFRYHAHEIEQLLAVHPQIQDDVSTALIMLDAGRALDAETCTAVGRVLDDLHRYAGVPLQRDIVRMRDELILARGHSLSEVLTPRARPSLV